MNGIVQATAATINETMTIDSVLLIETCPYSMIRKSGNRLSEKIMLNQGYEIMIRFNLIGSRSGDHDGVAILADDDVIVHLYPDPRGAGQDSFKAHVDPPRAGSST